MPGSLAVTVEPVEKWGDIKMLDNRVADGIFVVKLVFLAQDAVEFRDIHTVLLCQGSAERPFGEVVQGLDVERFGRLAILLHALDLFRDDLELVLDGLKSLVVNADLRAFAR